MAMLANVFGARNGNDAAVGGCDGKPSVTPWVVAVGMAVLALLTASCVETNTREKAATGTADYEAPNAEWDPHAPATGAVGESVGSTWTIEDVERGGYASLMGAGPAWGMGAMAGGMIVDFFAPARAWGVDAVGVASDGMVEVSRATTVASAARPTVVVGKTRASGPGVVVSKTARAVPVSKMSETQIAAYIASLKMCEPPFAAKRAAVVAATPSLAPTVMVGKKVVWSRGGPRMVGTLGTDTDYEPVTVGVAAVAPVETVTKVVTVQPATHLPVVRPMWAGLMGLGLWFAALAAGMGTMALAFVHARTMDREGNVRRDLTLRARLTLAFGAMSTLGLAACALGATMMMVSVGGAIQIAACAVVAVAAPVGMWMWMRGAVVEPVARATEAVAAMGTGDMMRAPINSTARDEIGELSRGIDRLAATVRDALTEVAISTAEMSGAAGEIASGAQQMSDAVGGVVKKCADAAAMASEASRVVAEGQGAIKRSAQDLRLVDEIAGKQTAGVKSICTRAERIGRIVELIEDLADRSHLVALNASVEASRAGAASGPFGRLAEEARSVAERAQNALAEVATTVTSLDADAKATGVGINETVRHARHGAEMAASVTVGMEKVAGRTGEVVGVTRTAVTAAEEAGADAAQSAAIAAQLASRTGDVMAVVGRFRLGTEKLIRTGTAGGAGAPLAVEASRR